MGVVLVLLEHCAFEKGAVSLEAKLVGRLMMFWLVLREDWPQLH